MGYCHASAQVYLEKKEVIMMVMMTTTTTMMADRETS